MLEWSETNTGLVLMTFNKYEMEVDMLAPMSTGASKVGIDGPCPPLEVHVFA